MSIKERLKKINSQELYVVTVIILVGALGFGLGRLSVVEEKSVPVSIQEGIKEGAVEDNNNKGSSVATTSRFVASRNGSKYYLFDCQSAKRIKEENRIWFNTREEAERAGYTPAANCPGL